VFITSSIRRNPWEIILRAPGAVERWRPLVATDSLHVINEFGLQNIRPIDMWMEAHFRHIYTFISGISAFYL